MTSTAVPIPDESHHWRVVGVIGIVALLLGSFVTWRFAEPWPIRLPVLRQLSALRMTERDGSEVMLDDLFGRVWVADFVFTSCAGPCPEMTRRMGELYKSYAGDDGVCFVSISVDPQRDTPAVLREYAERWGATDRRWLFLTGPLEEVKRLAVEQFAVGSVDDPIFHSTKFALVDRLGCIRGYYDGTATDEMDALRRDLRALLREKRR